MPAKLTIYPRLRASRFVLVEDGGTLLIGRDPQCGLVVDDPCVSKRHARLRWSDAGWLLEDLASKNGTRVNGESARGALLQSGDIVDLGGLAGRFELLTTSQAAVIASERLARIRTTAAMRRRLGAELEPQDLLVRFLESAIEVASAERGFVLLVGPDGNLRAEAAAGFTEHEVRDDSRFRGSVGAVREMLAAGRAVVVSDVAAYPSLGKRTSVVTKGIGSLACLPLRHDGDLIGLIYVDSRLRAPALTAVDLEILEALADHTAAVLGSHPPERRLARSVDDDLVIRLQQRLDELLPCDRAS